MYAEHIPAKSNIVPEQKTEQLVGEGVGFERIRRITGDLVGTVDRFNNGKRAEERDRVKHCFFVRKTGNPLHRLGLRFAEQSNYVNSMKI